MSYIDSLESHDGFLYYESREAFFSLGISKGWVVDMLLLTLGLQMNVTEILDEE